MIAMYKYISIPIGKSRKRTTELMFVRSYVSYKPNIHCKTATITTPSNLGELCIIVLK